MRNRSMTKVVALGLAFGLAACMDLDVVNENSPDRERALGDPASVESVMRRGFLAWYNSFHSLADVAVPFPMLGDEMFNTNTQRAAHWAEEPPFAFFNDQLSQHIWIPRVIWDNQGEGAASANDALTAIKNGMKIETLDPGAAAVTDNTDRAYVWSKIWQGINIGYIVLMMDRFAVATEDSVLPQGDALAAWEKDKLDDGANWREVMDVALRSLDEGIARAQTGAQWVTPATWINGVQYNNAQMIQFAHTAAARMMIYSARYPADRAALDWNKILDHTNKGLTYDWGPVLQAGIITDPSYLARLTTTGSTQFRADFRLIGRADQSGAYQAWLAQPVMTRAAFNIVTPDRRITGNTANSSGAYFRYQTGTSGFDPNRGTGYWSNYQWYKRTNTGYGGFGSSTGPFALFTADENRLYKAEALLRLGRVQEAVTEINVTRTRGVRIGATVFATNLPPLTTAGVPTVNGACVPRREDNTCGTVMDALMWERAIELTGLDPVRAWFDRRGFGELTPGTMVQMPVPARYLVGLGIPNYTFGGVGGVCSSGSACPNN